ncbi:MAG: PRC-barrel domain-containing protein [Thalassobaculaceae bacterium]
MLKKMLATTALVALMAGPAMVASTSDAAADEMRSTMTMQNYGTLDSEATNGYLASNLMGRSVYTSTADDAERVGEIDDALIGQDGSIKAVIIGVGGFLGMGEKDVAVDFDRLSLEKEPDGEGFILVSKVSKQELEDAAGFEREERDGSTMRSTAKNVPAGSTVAEVDKEATTTARSPEDNRAAFMDGKTKMSAEKLEAETLNGAWAYDTNFNHIGEVGEVLLTADGKIDAMVIDVGGFLGLGEKPVAMAFKEVGLYRDGDGDVFVAVPYSQDQLDSSTAYDEAAYTDNSDRMLMTPTPTN